MATKRTGFLQENGLSLVLVAFMVLSLAGQVFTGQAAYNDDRVNDGARALALGEYLQSGHFVSAIFENWESEFLQMGLYVLLTVRLRQKGSAESRPMDPALEEERIDDGPTPWPVTMGGWCLKLYGHSLSTVLGLLFLLSFWLHLEGSWRHELEERAVKGELPISLWTHFTDAQFWFESFQNWQSEFLAVFALVVLSIWLRQKDSPQSKPVEAPHVQTGT